MSAAPVIVVTPEQLRELVREAVRAELAVLAERAPVEWLDSKGAAALLQVIFESSATAATMPRHTTVWLSDIAGASDLGYGAKR